MLRMILLIGLLALGLTGCAFTSYNLLSEKHPEKSTVDVNPEIASKDKVGKKVWALIHLKNNGDKAVELDPSMFVLETEKGDSFDYVDWSHFMGTKPVRGGAKSLPPGRKTVGKVRWVWPQQTRVYKPVLKIKLDEGEHTFHYQIERSKKK